MTNKEYHVISHTHWDREWYQCFEVFRLRLVDLMDHLLEIYRTYPQFIFHLDAQTVCLEDYLAIRPQMRSRLEELITSGKLLVGPWYVQNDFYLTSGEATVRNLLIGSSMAEEFGCCDWIGYVPDQFGLIGQLPQIFSQFGIQSAFFGRGYSEYRKNDKGEYERCVQPAEFCWESGDGSSVHAVNLPNWYNNAQRFSPDPERAAKYLKHVDEHLEPYSGTPFRLLMNGVDHLEAQEDLLPILERLQAGLSPGNRIMQSTLAEYGRKTAAYLADKGKPVLQGELRRGRDHEILQGTLSSRRYLKVLNGRCQNDLELVLEPLFSGISVRTGGQVAYPADTLRYLWKTLLKNHAHDSICGCSTDRVHQDNENRFMRFLDAAGDLRRRGLQEFLNRISRDGIAAGEYLLAVVNTLPYPRSETVEAEVRIPLEDGVESFSLLDPEGQAVPFEIVRSVKRNRMTVSPINLPGQISVEEMTLRFPAKDIPASGYFVYRLVPGGARSETAPIARQGPTEMENEAFSVTVSEAGRVSLVCRESGRTIPDLISLEDVADKGDSYTFAAGSDPLDLSAVRPTVSFLEKSAFRQTIRLNYRLPIPLQFDRQNSRRSDELVESNLVLDLSLAQGSALLDIRGQLENASKDHRLRLLVHTGIEAKANLSSQPFECVERPRDHHQPDLRHNWSHPNNGWVSVLGDTDQFSVLTDGVYDYEHTGKSLAFTWVRATARIGDHAFVQNSNGVEPSPEWAVPENQCLREIPFHIALRSGFATPAELSREWQCWSAPLLTAFDSADPHKFLKGRPCLQDADLDENFYRDLADGDIRLPLRGDGPELTGDVVFSAYKQAEDNSGYIFRWYNPAAAEAEASLRITSNHTVCDVTLGEKETHAARSLSSQTGAKRIVTVKLV
jgi:hypothetical protein